MNNDVDKRTRGIWTCPRACETIETEATPIGTELECPKCGAKAAVAARGTTILARAEDARLAAATPAPIAKPDKVLPPVRIPGRIEYFEHARGERVLFKKRVPAGEGDLPHLPAEAIMEFAEGASPSGWEKMDVGGRLVRQEPDVAGKLVIVDEASGVSDETFDELSRVCKVLNVPPLVLGAEAPLDPVAVERVREEWQRKFVVDGKVAVLQGRWGYARLRERRPGVSTPCGVVAEHKTEACCSFHRGSAYVTVCVEPGCNWFEVAAFHDIREPGGNYPDGFVEVTSRMTGHIVVEDDAGAELQGKEKARELARRNELAWGTETKRSLERPCQRPGCRATLHPENPAAFELRRGAPWNMHCDRCGYQEHGWVLSAEAAFVEGMVVVSLHHQGDESDPGDFTITFRERVEDERDERRRFDAASSALGMAVRRNLRMQLASVPAELRDRLLDPPAHLVDLAAGLAVQMLLKGAGPSPQELARAEADEMFATRYLGRFPLHTHGGAAPHVHGDHDHRVTFVAEDRGVVHIRKVRDRSAADAHSHRGVFGRLYLSSFDAAPVGSVRLHPGGEPIPDGWEQADDVSTFDALKARLHAWSWSRERLRDAIWEHRYPEPIAWPEGHVFSEPIGERGRELGAVVYGSKEAFKAIRGRPVEVDAGGTIENDGKAVALRVDPAKGDDETFVTIGGTRFKLRHFSLGDHRRVFGR